MCSCCVFVALAQLLVQIDSRVVWSGYGRFGVPKVRGAVAVGDETASLSSIG